MLPKVIEELIFKYLWSFEHPTARMIKEAKNNLILPLTWKPGCIFSRYSTLMDFHTKHIPFAWGC